MSVRSIIRGLIVVIATDAANIKNLIKGEFKFSSKLGSQSLSSGIPVNGGWSAFSPWSKVTCPTTNCGFLSSQTETRTRKCNAPAPSHGVTNCIGDKTNRRIVTCGIPCQISTSTENIVLTRTVTILGLSYDKFKVGMPGYIHYSNTLIEEQSFDNIVYGDGLARIGKMAEVYQTSHQVLLSTVSKEVKKHFKVKFTSIWMLSIAFKGTSGQNTFDTILVTDGTKTFIRNRYKEVTSPYAEVFITEIHSGLPGPVIHYKHPLHKKIDSPKVSRGSNVGVPGTYWFRVDTTFVQPNVTNNMNKI